MSWVVVALMAGAFTTACRAAMASDDISAFPSTTAVAASSVGNLTLESIDSLQLGVRDSTQIGRVTHFLPTADRYYVIDGVSKHVLAFDHHGVFVSQIGRTGAGLDEYEDPYRVAVRGDSVFVLDLARFSHVLAFDRAGSYIGGFDWKNERMPTDLLLTPSGMIISTTVQPEQGRVANVLHLVGAGDDGEATSCQVDPRIVESERKNGMLGALAFARLSAFGDRVYCAQATTPVVQVVDTTGRRLAPLTIKPPFYIAPVDRPLTMNTKHMMAFNASFTTHVSFAPTRSGFVSTYSQYDTTSQRTSYLLFACDSAQGSRQCGTARTERRVVHFATPDTLYLEEPRAGGSLVIGRYRLRMESHR